MKYEVKFKGLIAATKKAQADKAVFFVVSIPETLGDDYDELVESLMRISAANMAVKIVPPSKNLQMKASLN